jgi:hypothetical protein
MLKTNNEYKMDRQDYKRRIMENRQTEANINSDKKKKMEWDWAHIMQRSRSKRENLIRLESSGHTGRGRPKRTWRRTIEDEIKKHRKTMERVQRDSWRSQCLKARHGCPVLHKE